MLHRPRSLKVKRVPAHRAFLDVLAAGLGVGLWLGLAAGPGALPARAAGGTAGGLAVSVGYAEDKETNNPNPANFPVPWQGSPNTIFIGGPVVGQTQCGTLPSCFDAGAIRLDNPTAADIAVSDLKADIHSSIPGGKVIDLWGSFTVPAGKSVILTENPPGDRATSDDFDSSGYPGNVCAPILVAPTVTTTIAGRATTLVDSTHVLDTGGIDQGYCASGSARNESIQWRPIGTAGSSSAALSLAPGVASAPVGGSVVETATLLDGAGARLANVSVLFAVVSGPNAGTTGTAVTDANGNAAFTYQDMAAGTDLVAASVTTIGTFSSQAVVVWGTASPVWTGQDIGSPPIPGTDSLVGGTWTVSGSGRDLGGTSDQFHYVWQPLGGDGSLSTRVVTETNSNSRARAGVMLRQSADPASAFYAAVATPGSGLWVMDRPAYGAPVVTLANPAGHVPVYLRIERAGASVDASTSADGVAWTPIAGSAATFAVSGALLVGLAVTSHTLTAASTATFDGLVLVGPSAGPTPSPTAASTSTAAPTPTSAPTLAPTPVPTVAPSPAPTGATGALPAPWLDTDVGSPLPPGSATYGGGVFTVNGSGTDIWGTSDQFNYVYQAVAGNGTVIARVTSQSATGSSNSKAGVIWKASTAAGSPYILVETGPSGIVKVQYGFGSSIGGATYAFPNVWLKLVRSGSSFSAYVSGDGVAWNAIVSGLNLAAIPAAATVGIFECSHKPGVVGTATIDNVTFTAGP